MGMVTLLPTIASLDVGGHIVGAFEGVCQERQVFRHDLVEDTLKINAHRRVGIFIDRQTGRGVLDEERQQACFR